MNRFDRPQHFTAPNKQEANRSRSRDPRLGEMQLKASLTVNGRLLGEVEHDSATGKPRRKRFGRYFLTDAPDSVELDWSGLGNVFHLKVPGLGKLPVTNPNNGDQIILEHS